MDAQCTIPSMTRVDHLLLTTLKNSDAKTTAVVKMWDSHSPSGKYILAFGQRFCPGNPNHGRGNA